MPNREGIDADCDSSFEMPRWNIDRLMTHVAAAALIVDDHEVDVSDLRDDLKIDNKAYVQCATSVSIIANARQNPSILC